MSEPLVSVLVVATASRAATVCLAALGRSLEDIPYELVVAPVGDVALTDEAIAAPAGARRLAPAASPGAALRGAVAAARAPLCALVDEDARIDHAALAVHLARQQEGAAVVVGATTLVGRGSGWLGRAQHGHGHPGGRFGPGLDGTLSAPRAALAEPDALDFLADDARPLLHAQLALLLAARGLPVVAEPAALARRDGAPGDRALELALARLGALGHALWRREPTHLRLALGGFQPETGRADAIARALLVARAPARLPALLDRVLGRGDAARGWWQARAAHAFWQGVPPSDRRRLRARVPILMYHGFLPAGTPASRYAIPADRFASHVRALRLLRRRPLTTAALVARWAAGDPPRRAVVVTIDDGYRNVGELAAPILGRARIPATLYVVTDLLGGTADWDADALSGAPMLDVAATRRLARAGWEIGPHTRTHARLTDLDDDAVDDEIAGSSARVRADVQEPRTFAYPFGAHDARSVAAVERLGLAAVVTVHGRAGVGDDPARLPRIEVTGATGTRRLVLAVLLGRRCHVR